MSDIIFNPGDRNYVNRGGVARGPGGLTSWFMRVTGIQSEAGANLTLFVLAIIFFIATVFVVIGYF